ELGDVEAGVRHQPVVAEVDGDLRVPLDPRHRVDHDPLRHVSPNPGGTRPRVPRVPVFEGSPPATPFPAEWTQTWTPKRLGQKSAGRRKGSYTGASGSPFFGTSHPPGLCS